MKCIIVLLLLAVCHADDLASPAGQTSKNILPSLIQNQAASSDGNSSQNTVQIIGTVVGGTVENTKNDSYDDLLKQVQESTTDKDLLRVSKEMFNANIKNANQTSKNIPPSLIKNQAASSNSNNSQNTVQTIGKGVGGAVENAKNNGYDDLHKQVQDSTTDNDLLPVSEEMFNADITNADQTSTKILPSLIKNQTASSDRNSSQSTLQISGTVVSGAVDNAKKDSYDDFLKQVREFTTYKDLLRVSEEMFNADINNAFNYIQVNLQGEVFSTMSKDDKAPTNLLTVSDDVLNGPTIKPFMVLFANYHKKVIRPEFVNPNDERDQTAYINTILATGPVRSLMSFLVSKGLTQLNDYQEQVELLRKIWFTKYPRRLTRLCKCSCAFENIFMGLRSWLFFAKQEEDRKVNYLGYFYKRDLAGKGLLLRPHLIVSETKDASEVTMFVGTSPELEIALYTFCFMARPDWPCELHYHNATFYIHAKTIKSENVKLLDTAFPII